MLFNDLLSLLPFVVLIPIIHFFAWITNKFSRNKHTLTDIIKMLIYFYKKEERPTVLNRADFFVATLVHQNLIIISLIFILFLTLFQMPQLFLIIIVIPIVLYMCFIGLGISLMRLHDLNLSGYYLLAFIILMSITGALGNTDNENFNIFDYLNLIIILVYVYVLYFKKSVIKNNKFI